MPSTPNHDGKIFFVGLIVLIVTLYALLRHYGLDDEVGPWVGRMLNGEN